MGLSLCFGGFVFGVGCLSLQDKAELYIPAVQFSPIFNMVPSLGSLGT